LAERTIVTVNCEVPGFSDHYVALESDRSLLDADLIVFQPGFPAPAFSSGDSHQGKPCASESWSFRIREAFSHWRSEIKLAVEQGKTVVVYLVKPIDAFAYTGEKQFSGTGRNRLTTNIVSAISSYDVLPFRFESLVPKGGESIKVAGDLKHLAEYWREMGSHSAFEVHLAGKFTNTFLTTKAGDRVVGADLRSKGTFLFLPPVQYDELVFTRPADAGEEVEEGEDEEGEEGKGAEWTEEGVNFGRRWISSLLSIDDALRAAMDATPPPEWAQAAGYRLPTEQGLEAELTALNEELRQLGEQRSRKTQELATEGSLRALLFAKGKQLESAVLEALTLLGFTATHVADADSEFDVVFQSPEGRFLGEVEGRDAKSINIDKLSQLERNIQEDFAREGVTDYAKGVLFGNAFRIQDLPERGEYFTAKCVSGAKRGRIALVRTPDLFSACKAIKSGAGADFAMKCRQAILQAEGVVVTFPVAPPPDMPLTDA
jgi:hypothetical protein